ncbi:hypothetical protein L0Y65_04220 [Candidatus Micrarchaeota archaeon]|nr:hypothetical protein [Candidatus Micrarchaeota archaeon]
MAKNPPIGTASKRDVDEYFEARNRELTRRAQERSRNPSAEPPIKSRPVEFVELFNTDSIEKDYGAYRISYENGRGFRKKMAGSGSWGPASAEEIRIFKDDVRNASAQNPKIARYIANDSEFR